MANQEFHFCPGCGSFYDNWDALKGVCPYCGFDRNIEKLSTGSNATPEKCDEHPKYEGVGAPRADCLVCWKMHRGYVEGKIKELKDDKENN